MSKKRKSKNSTSLADQVRGKKQSRQMGVSDAVRKNPFEMKINRQKHSVVGKKLSKFDKGIPGVSRSKAVKKVRVSAIY